MIDTGASNEYPLPLTISPIELCTQIDVWLVDAVGLSTTTHPTLVSTRSDDG